jgi:hypothetical protein
MSIYANQNDALSSEIQTTTTTTTTTTESVELLTSATIEAEEPINTTPAYVYRLICKPTGQFYYGLRYANIKKYRMPEDDLWIYYFASSDPVDALVEIYGKDSFDYKVIFQSTDIEQTYLFEQTIIKAYWGNPLLLNLQYKDPVTGGKMWAGTAESKQKGVETGNARGSYKVAGERRKADGTAKLATQKAVATKKKLGIFETSGKKGGATRKANGTSKLAAQKAVATKKKRGTHKIGGKRSGETRIRNGTGKIGAQKGAETRKRNGTSKISAQKSAETRKRNGTDKIAAQKAVATRAKNGKDAEHSSIWQLTKPDGEVIVIKNLAKFCRENDLSADGMQRCSSGLYKQHKGWKCKKLVKPHQVENKTDELKDN